MGRMRKSLVFIPCLILCSAVCAVLNAQQPAANSLPTDPTALMTLAHDRNGLEDSDVRPWHIRASYTFYDAKGHVERTGTYEEWWESPAKYKRVFNSPQFSQTEYGDGTQLLREGAQEWPDSYELLARSLLLNPVPAPAELKSFDLKEKAIHIGSVNLNCIWTEYPLNNKLSGAAYPGYCFETNLPLLRLQVAPFTRRTTYTKMVAFQGHYIAREIHVYDAGKNIIDLTVNVLENLKTQDESQLTPSAGAKPVDLASITFSDSQIKTTLWPRIRKEQIPVYPQLAKTARIQGTVVIHATIEKDGHLDNLKVISGPNELRQSSLDAVSQWIYEPVVMLGEPRVVGIEIKTIYSMGW